MELACPIFLRFHPTFYNAPFHYYVLHRFHVAGPTEATPLLDGRRHVRPKSVEVVINHVDLWNDEV